MLKISAAGEHALMLVRYLSRNPGIHPISEIIEVLGVKEPFIRKVANRLETKGIILSHKGRNGGLESGSHELSVYDVLSAAGEDLNITLCKTESCGLSGTCGISPVIGNLQRGFDAILKITKL